MLIRIGGGATSVQALIDDADAMLVAQFRWHPAVPHRGQARRYAVARVGPERRTLYMHRLILGLEPDDPREVDHINRNGLDNRRANLRVVTRPENRQNLGPRRGSSSRFRGVTWQRDKGKWRARVRWQGRSYSLGYFADERAAAEAVSRWRAENMPFSVEALPN